MQHHQLAIEFLYCSPLSHYINSYSLSPSPYLPPRFPPLGGHSITQSVGCTAFASLAAQLTLSIYPTQVCPLGVAQSTGVVSRQSGSISLSFNVTAMRYRIRRMSCRSLLSRERRKSTLSSGNYRCTNIDMQCTIYWEIV